MQKVDKLKLEDNTFQEIDEEVTEKKMELIEENDWIIKRNIVEDPNEFKYDD